MACEQQQCTPTRAREDNRPEGLPPGLIEAPVIELGLPGGPVEVVVPNGNARVLQVDAVGEAGLDLGRVPLWQVVLFRWRTVNNRALCT